MAKILTQIEKEKILNDYMEIIKTTDGVTNPFALMQFVTTVLPNFFQSLIDIGYKAGFEDGKNLKINNLIKNN